MWFKGRTLVMRREFRVQIPTSLTYSLKNIGGNNDLQRKFNQQKENRFKKIS